MKRVFSVVFTLLMVASCLNVSVSAIKKKYTIDENASYWAIATETTKTSSPKQTATTAYQYDKNGRVVTITETSDRGGEKEWENEKIKYDSRGRITRSDFDTSIGLDGVGRYKYNADGNITFCDFSGTGYESFSYSYNSDGKVSKLVKDGNDGEKITVKYTYNSEGLRTKSTTYYNGKKFNITSYKYNSDGFLSSRKTVYYKIQRVVVSSSSVKSSYKYDAKGNLIKISFKDFLKNGKTSSGSIDYKYDSNGNLLKRVYNDGSGFYDYYTYDKKGRLTKEKHNDDNYGKSATTYKYDSSGKLKKKVIKYTDFVETTEYTYLKLSKQVFKTSNGISLEKCNYKYDGKEKKPLVFIDGIEKFYNNFEAFNSYYRGEFFKGPDYILKYSDNVKPGKAKVKVRFNNPDDPELFGKTITLTFNILPEKVKNIKASKIGKESVTLTWSKVPNAQKYIVYSYYDATGKYGSNGKGKVAVVKTNKAVLKELSPGTNYRFTVKAVVGGVTGQAGKDVKLKTAK